MAKILNFLLNNTLTMDAKINKHLLSLIAFTFLIFFPIHSNARTYNIGAEYQYKNLEDLNWDALEPGDIVRIHWKKEPYREKLVIRCSGTKEKPIIIRGIRGPSRNLPIIDGSGAKQFQKMRSSLKARRGLIIIGDGISADNIVVEGLEIRNANSSLKFRWGTNRFDYADNAAGIFVDKSKNVQVKTCKIHTNGMGILTGHYPNVDKFTLSTSFIYNNGDFRDKPEGQRGQNHNVYLSARSTVVQFSRFGELHSDGNNIKSRSQKAIIRYNWIEGGMSRQIDLVEYKEYEKADAFVYGNVIVQGEKVLNPKMILFGGDIGGSRGGTLYFFNNTVYAKSGKLHAFLVVNKPDCNAILKNNFMLGKPNIWIGSGNVTGSNNLFPHGANTNGFTNTFFGGHEQKIDYGLISYFPKPNSFLIDRGTLNVPAKIKYMPLPFPGGKKRPFDNRIDIGAFEMPKKRKKRIRN